MKKSLGLLSCILLVSIFLIGCGGSEVNKKTNNNQDVSSVPMVLDATQFSRISSEQLISIMGEPEKIEDYKWTIPQTGEKIVGKLYIYEQNKYEFILFDDSVTRLNVYSGTFMGYDDSTLAFFSEEDIFSMFAIIPNSYLKKVADTNYALRYSPVSDDVAEVWIQEINDNHFGIAKITYNLNYY